MRKFNLTLIVLLCISIGFNVAAWMKLRQSGQDRTDSAQKAVLDAKASTANDVEELRKQLAAAEKHNEDLRQQIGQIANGAPPVAPAPSAPVTADDSTALREKLKKLYQILEQGPLGERDTEEMTELVPFFMELWPIFVSPSKDPAKYARVIEAMTEVSMEVYGLPLSAEQKNGLSELVGAAQSALARVPRSPASERLMSELKAERELTGHILDLLTPEQRQKAAEKSLNSSWEGGNTEWISREGAASQIAEDWIKRYKLDENQRPLVEATARSYAETLSRLHDQYQAQYGYAPISGLGQDPAKRDPYAQVHAFDYRIEALQAQMEALKQLEGGASPEQQKLLKEKSVQEFDFMNSTYFKQVVEPEK
ncbi:MAG: hypothetical protein HYY16_03005 [Planctomycetes bacterium]|nr:hypothetical protein [Planctomycetota bacterium]